MRLDELKQKRQGAGLSQRNLAQKIGISRSSLSLLENGKRKPSYDVLKKIAEEMGEPIEFK